MDRWLGMSLVLVGANLAGCAGARVRHDGDPRSSSVEPVAGARVVVTGEATAGPAVMGGDTTAAAEAPGRAAAPAAEVEKKSPYLGAEPIELSSAIPMNSAAPAAAASRRVARSADLGEVASTRATPARRPSGAGSGALAGAGVVLGAWLGVCFVGGPLTLVLCVVGFPTYWSYLAAATVGGIMIGAAIGAAANAVAENARRDAEVAAASSPARTTRSQPRRRMRWLTGRGLSVAIRACTLAMPHPKGCSIVPHTMSGNYSGTGIGCGD